MDRKKSPHIFCSVIVGVVMQAMLLVACSTPMGGLSRGPASLGSEADCSSVFFEEAEGFAEPQRMLSESDIDPEGGYSSVTAEGVRTELVLGGRVLPVRFVAVDRRPTFRAWEFLAKKRYLQAVKAAGYDSGQWYTIQFESESDADAFSIFQAVVNIYNLRPPVSGDGRADTLNAQDSLSWLHEFQTGMIECARGSGRNSRNAWKIYFHNGRGEGMVAHDLFRALIATGAIRVSAP